MIRTFYSYAIFFTALYIAASLFQSIILFALGSRMYELASLKDWMRFMHVTSLVWSLILVGYYHYRQYWVAQWALICFSAISFVHFITFMQVLETREMTSYYIATMLLAAATGILYGISLILSKARKNPWLRACGISFAFVGLASLSMTLWGLNSAGVMLNGTLEKAEQWISLIAAFIPAFFLMNFVSERKDSRRANNTGGYLSWATGIAGLLALVLLLVFAPRLSGEMISAIRNPNQVPERVKTLAEPFEARSYIEPDGDSLLYRLMFPLDYDSTQRYPLVVCLHGSSGCGSDNSKQVATSFAAELLMRPENRIKYPAFLFVPQCPLRSGWGGIPGLPAVDSLVFDCIIALQQEFPIDRKRCYVSGSSLGGYGSWHLISTHPEMFAAAVPICGEGNPDLAERVVDVPVWAFHGAKDMHVPVSGSRDMVAAIKVAGGDPRYTEFPNQNHHIWRDVANTPGLLDWMFAQRRE